MSYLNKIDMKVKYIVTLLTTLFFNSFSTVCASPFIFIEDNEVLGCIDANAIDYNPQATVQAYDQWGNTLCIYASCNEVPYDGCMYEESYSPWFDWFNASDCINYGGVPCAYESTDSVSGIVFSNPFGGSYVEGNTYLNPASSESWAGFANEDASLYPISFEYGGMLSFSASTNGGSAEVYFRFEYNTYPDTEPSYNTSSITVDGADNYFVTIPSQSSNTYSSFILYVVTQEVEVTLTNVTLSIYNSIEASDIIGCIDPNATDYNPAATLQGYDEWSNIECTYSSCSEVPDLGCIYSESYGFFDIDFGPAECIDFGGIPCEILNNCEPCAYNEVCIDSICQSVIPVNTNLPVVYITTENQQGINSTDNYVEGRVTLEGGQSVTSDSLIYGLDTLAMKIRGRGNSTWFLHPKKPYQMKLDSKEEFLGMPDDKKWIFLAEHSDKSMLRNTLAFEMGYSSVLDWTPEGEFAEVYINGVYNGTYNITQKVEEKSNRVDIGNDGFLLEVDQLERLDDDDHYFTTPDFPVIAIKEPDVNDMIEDDGQATADSTIAVITNFVNEFETVLHSDNFADTTNGYHKYIDVESFIDWFLINEITKNVDAKNFSSIYFNVIIDDNGEGKLKMGPLWDYDLSLGNNDYSDCEFYEGWWVRNHPWINRLFEDAEFSNQVTTRFEEHFYPRKDSVLNKIDMYSNALTASAVENDARWQPYLGSYVWPNPNQGDVASGNTAEQGYADAIDHVANWYAQRMDWLNEHLNQLTDEYGCLDLNALNYSIDANEQAYDQWNNILCAYASCDDTPGGGCLYDQAWASFNSFFGPDDCMNYGGVACLESNIGLVEQALIIPQGWSIFSTYMAPFNNDITVVLAPIVDDLIIVKDYLGLAYLTEWNYNGIGDMQIGQGYQIKTSNNVELIIEGDQIVPEENIVPLLGGWNMIGYLRLEEADATLVFEDLVSANNLIIAKDYYGSAYLPEWNFNGIGTMKPGEGYQIKTNVESVLEYLPNNSSY